MKKPAMQSKFNPTQMTSSIGTAPAPVGGWNTRDAIAAMPPTDAAVLDNFYPSSTSVDLRLGSATWARGFAARVESLISYASPTTQKLFGCDSTGIFDITAGGLIGAAATSLVNGYGQYINFTTAAGSYVQFVNGQNKLKLYDGAVWSDIDGVSVPAITGIATTDIININSFKNRIWYVLRDSLDVWYLPVASIGGAAVKFALGGLFKKGGFLMAMGTWTIDGGAGVDDFAVFATSKGELAVYQGTDPSSPTTWALVGVYYIGEPLGRRCFTKYGGDLLYLCKQGLFPLSKALQTASIDRTMALSDKISPTFSESATAYGANKGWEATIFPAANMVLVNVPAFIGSASYQYTMNNLTQSWCRFTDWTASCFIVYNENLYYGGENTVTQAWTGIADNDAYVTGVALTAYTYLNYAGEKHMKMIRPNLQVDSAYDLYLGVDFDYSNLVDYSTVLASVGGTSLWSVGLWDVAVYGGGPTIVRQWNTVPANTGSAVALKMQIRTKLSGVRWISTDFVYETGGVL
jgi:hypothetical protein